MASAGMLSDPAGGWKGHVQIAPDAPPVTGPVDLWNLPEGWTVAPPALTREQKRTMLRAIGVRVLIYATKSGYKRDNGKRWDMQIIPGVYASEMTHERVISPSGVL